jgi:hypothetical protein
MNDIQENTPVTDDTPVTPVTVEKVSDINAQAVADYLRIVELADEDEAFINTSIKVATDYILKYTGIENAEDLDAYTDMIIVVYVLCQDMYDNRALYVDNSNLNTVVENILGLHQRNLL